MSGDLAGLLAELREDLYGQLRAGEDATAYAIGAIEAIEDRLPALLATPAEPARESDGVGLRELAARAVAEAAGDGCFDRIDRGECDCAESDPCPNHEDAAYWQTLADAALRARGQR